MNNHFAFKKSALKRALVPAFIIGTAFVATNSYAATASANMPVTASIAANCTISASTLAFGAYDPIVTNAAANLDNTATLTTTCTTGSAPTITLDEGLNKAAGSTSTAPARQLISGANVLAYSLYSDSGRTTVWANTGVATPAASGTAQTNTVYGRIPSGQNKPVGAYTDTIVATVTF
jgi:spore coat protein U-like protein